MKTDYFDFKGEDPSTLQAEAHAFMREGLTSPATTAYDSFINLCDLGIIPADMLEVCKYEIQPLLLPGERMATMELYEDGFNLWIKSGVDTARGIFRFRR